MRKNVAQYGAALLLFGSLLLSAGSLQAAQITHDSSTDATTPSLAMGPNGIRYLTWLEGNQIYVSHWNGIAWAADGGGLKHTTNKNVSNPCLVVSSTNMPVVAWEENDANVMSLYVSHFQGSWVSNGTSLNRVASNSACYPSLAFAPDGTLFAAWQEYSGSVAQIYVSHWNGYTWVNDGNALNADVTRNAYYPQIAVAPNGTPYVAWYEDKGGIMSVYVSSWNGIKWKDQLECINRDASQNAIYPRIAIASNNTPYVVWKESDGLALQLYASCFKNGGWQNAGSSLNFDCTRNVSGKLGLAISAAGMPYVAWCEETASASRILMKHWTGSVWASDVKNNSGLNRDNFSSAAEPSLAIAPDLVPQVAWQEKSGTIWQIYNTPWEEYSHIQFWPNAGLVHTQVTATLVGDFINSGATIKLVNLDQEIIGTEVQIDTEHRATCHFMLPSTPAVYDCTISRSGLSQTLTGCLESIKPMTGENHWVCEKIAQAGPAAHLGNYGKIILENLEEDKVSRLYVASQGQNIFRVTYQSDWKVTTVGTSPETVYFTSLDCLDNKFLAGTNQNSVFEYSFLPGGSLLKRELKLGSSRNDVVGEVGHADSNGNGYWETYAASTDRSVYQLGVDQVQAQGAGRMFAIARGDLDGDSQDEVYLANEDHYLYQLIGKQKDNTFANKKALNNFGQETIQALCCADLDLDGIEELYCGSSSGNVYSMVKSSTTLSAPKLIGTMAGSITALSAGDADNDGILEIYAAGDSGQVVQFRVQATVWKSADMGAAQAALTSLVLGDPDHDHQIEVYALGKDAGVYQYRLASGPAVTPTPTPDPSQNFTPTVVVPDSSFKILNNVINPNHWETARIHWSQPQSGAVSIIIYNMLGEKVVTLVDQEVYSGNEYHDVLWKGINQNNNKVGSGIYLVQLKTQGFESRGKIAIIK